MSLFSRLAVHFGGMRGGKQQLMEDLRLVQAIRAGEITDEQMMQLLLGREDEVNALAKRLLRDYDALGPPAPRVPLTIPLKRTCPVCHGPSSKTIILCDTCTQIADEFGVIVSVHQGLRAVNEFEQIEVSASDLRGRFLI